MYKILIPLITLFSNSLFGQNRFVVNVKCPPNFNNHVVYLKISDSYSNNRFDYVDSIKIENNEFSFSGLLPKFSEDATIYIPKVKFQKYFIVDSGFNYIKIELVSRYRFRTTKIETASSILKERIDSLVLVNSQILSTKKKKSIDEYYQAIRVQRQMELKLIRSYSSTFYSLIQLYKLSYLIRSLSNEELISTFYALDISLQRSELGLELHAKLLNGILINENKSLPEFAFNDISGNVFTKDSLKEKIYLIAFGATWCGPCKENIPMLKDLYNLYKNKDFDIVYINMDNDVAAWKKMINDYKMEWINLTDINKRATGIMANRFNINALPLYLIVNQSKRIIYNQHNNKDFDYSVLKNRLNKEMKK